MVTMAEESHQMGAATMEQLYHQGEQLDRINNQTDVIHEDIKATEKNLDNLEKCCGIFVLPWKRVKRPGNEKNFKEKTYTAPTTQEPAKSTFGRKAPTKGDVAQPDGPFITRILDDDREDEMEHNLHHVSNIVGELKTMAVDMNQEIAIHNQKIDHIAAKTDDNQLRLDTAQFQATRIVGKPAKPSSDPLIPKPGIGMVAKQMANQAMNLLKGDATEAANGVPAPSGPSLRADTPPGDSEDPPMLNSNSKELNAVPSMPAVTESTNDSQLFEFLNNPAPMEQAISVLDSPKQSLAPLNVSLSSSPTHPNQQTTEHLEARSSPPQQLVPSQSQASVLPKNSTDISMENRLLHQEIASLNQEIAELVKRNKRIEAQKNKEVSHLQNQIQSMKSLSEEIKMRNLQRTNSSPPPPTDGPDKTKELGAQVVKLTKILTSTRQALTESENKAAESLKLANISSSRVEQLQQEVARLTRSLASYKEKAAVILADKDKIISDLREQLNPSSSDDGPVGRVDTADADLRKEYEQLREETISLRQEAEQRLMVASELEERAFEEHASLRRTISLLEQQLQREKQLVADSDAEIIDLQRRLTVAEEEALREKTAITSRLQAAEAEVVRLRRCLSSETSVAASTPPPSPPSQPQPLPDSDRRIFELEARARHLNDCLLTKQDALDATLAQNHALKIRLERLEAECDAHLLENRNPQSAAFASGYPQFPLGTPSSGSSQGFARLYLIDTSLPDWLRGMVSSIDDWTIRLVAMLRRRPLIRLQFIAYLGVFHFWLLCNLLFFTPSLSSSPPSHM